MVQQYLVGIPNRSKKRRPTTTAQHQHHNSIYNDYSSMVAGFLLRRCILCIYTTSMVDILLDSNFDVRLDDTNDLATVDERAEFEQRLRLALTRRYYELIGDGPRGTIIEMLRVEAERVADDLDQLDNLQHISIEDSELEPNTIEVTAVYDVGDDVSFEITD